MNLIKYFLFCFALLCSLSVKAQFDAQFSQYWAVTGYYNPAYAGQTDKLIITGAYSQQLMGFTNAPKSMFFAADMPVKFLGGKHGVGVTLFNEGIGLFRNQIVGLQYSYKKQLGKGQMGVGLQVGALNLSFDPTNINLGDQTNDDAFPATSVSGTSMDAGIGVYYTHPQYYGGLSVSHLSAPTVLMGENNKLKVDPTIYLTGGCNIKTKNPLIWLQPSFLLKSDLVSTKVDFTGRMFYNYNEKTLYGGLSYSPGTSVTFLVGTKIKNITVGYAYEMFTSQIWIGSGSHDLFINYSTDINFSGHSKNRHKSIRIL